MARDFSYLVSSQPSASQSSRDNASDEEEGVERAFWQSTPTALEQFRRGADDECHQTQTRAPVQGHDDEKDRPGDPLCLSTQQSRLLRQTWSSSFTSQAGRTIFNSPDFETRPDSSRSQRHHPRDRRIGGSVGGDGSDGGGGGGSSGPHPTIATDPLSLPDQYSTFRYLKNIEKVCKTVDERIERKKVVKEWSSRMISETARLRDEVDEDQEGLDVLHGEHPRHNGNAVEVDASHDRLPTTPQSMEEVPTSQSQERYLSLSQVLTQ
ncbi:hypothetical protein BC827DRAFT_1265270 [Russula dissimulans]|nr:hypothetical protein BC827DRAFT_1265270 [Russula dissimulans]